MASIDTSKCRRLTSYDPALPNRLSAGVKWRDSNERAHPDDHPDSIGRLLLQAGAAALALAKVVDWREQNGVLAAPFLFCRQESGFR